MTDAVALLDGLTEEEAAVASAATELDGEGVACARTLDEEALEAAAA